MAIDVIQGIFAGLIGLGIIAMVGFTVSEKILATQTADTAGYNGTVSVQSSMIDAVDWLPAIVPILIGLAIYGYFVAKRK
jgi:hypothetical protein